MNGIVMTPKRLILSQPILRCCERGKECIRQTDGWTDRQTQMERRKHKISTRIQKQLKTKMSWRYRFTAPLSRVSRPKKFPVRCGPFSHVMSNFLCQLSYHEKQGLIHDIRCIPVLHYAIFSDFHGPVDGWTNGHTLLQRFEDASKNIKKFITRKPLA